ncbi:hypothetical protein SH467x_001910 [Pirellulaceae bacterium SH467]|jgi:hypothetical protein
MFFWLREIAGWALVGLALYILWIGLGFLSDLNNPKIIESSVLNLAGLGVLKAGLTLIRLSTTARIALKLSRSER